MILAFDPEPNPFRPPKIFTAGVGRRMTAVAGEVADGFLVHPVNSRRSLTEVTLPAIQLGLPLLAPFGAPDAAMGEAA